MLDKNKEALLVLIRKALWNSDEELPDADWAEVEKCAQEQGVLWMAYLGGKSFSQQIPAAFLKSWRTVFHSGVAYNEQINSVQSELTAWLEDHGIRAAILKGMSCSRYYPYPDTRPLGDIDVLVDKCNMDAVGDYLIEQGYTPDHHAHDFHIGYYGKDAVIEVHYAGTDVPMCGGGKIVSEEMKNFLDSTQLAIVGKLTFPVLSDSYQALMLLLHMERHMIVRGIGFRQLCDWATFVKNSPAEHWQNGTLKLFEKCGLLMYAKVITKVCVDYFGLNDECVGWCRNVSTKLSAAMLRDVFRGGNMGTADQEGAGSLFTERSALGKKGQNIVKGLLARLTILSFRHWPITEKYKMLLPFCWVYLPLRYLIRAARGMRPKKNIAYVVSVSNQRQKLYSALKLYEIKNDN